MCISEIIYIETSQSIINSEEISFFIKENGDTSGNLALLWQCNDITDLLQVFLGNRYVSRSQLVKHIRLLFEDLM